MNPGPIIPDLGRVVEDTVETLCANCFSPDHIVRSPKYRKGRLEKEAADLMVVLGGTMLVLQVKTRILPAGNESTLSAVETDRFTRMLGGALDQFRALLEAIKDPDFGSFQNARGLPIRFERGTQKRMVLIVVYAVLFPDGSRPQFNLRLTKSCHSELPIPIHLFSLGEFEILTKLLNTFPDFVQFLEMRENLQALELIDKLAEPLDVWAAITFEKSRVKEAVEQKSMLKLDGTWQRHGESLAQLEKAEQPSYLVDWLIAGLHSNSGQDLVVHPYIQAHPGLGEPPGSYGAYQRAVPFFAQLNRADRTKLAEELMIRVERSQDGNDSFGGLKFEAQEEGFLVLSCHGPRTDRQLALHNLALGLAHKLNVKRAVCVGTGPRGPLEDGCDVLIVEVPTPEVSQEIRNLADGWFAPAREVNYPA